MYERGVATFHTTVSDSPVVAFGQFQGDTEVLVGKVLAGEFRLLGDEVTLLVVNNPPGCGMRLQTPYYIRKRNGGLRRHRDTGQGPHL